VADEIILVVLCPLEVIKKDSENSSVKFQGTATFYVKWFCSGGKLDSIISVVIAQILIPVFGFYIHPKWVY